MKYGLGVLATSLRFRLERMKLSHFKIFTQAVPKAPDPYYTEIGAAASHTDKLTHDQTANL